MQKAYIFVLAVIIISFAIGIYFYPQMPEKFASHWDATGTVDGYLSKFWGLFIMPIISVGLFLLFIVIPRIDPLKKNIEKFRKYFDIFIVLFFLFLFYLFILTILWNIGFRFNIIQLLSPAFSVLFFYCGVLVENAKMNWFIGIRTPWTLSSQKVWERTHKIGGKMFKACGIISLGGVLVPNYGMWLIIVPVVFTAVYTIVYSYFEYKK